LILLILPSLLSCSAEDVTGPGGGDSGRSPSGSARAEFPEGTEASAEPDYLYSAFTLTGDDLERITEDLPEAIRGRIFSDPVGFLEALEPVLRTDPDFLRLVDKDHPLAADYAPEDLVLLDETGLSVSRPGHRLRRTILIDLGWMSEEARDEGITLLISSAYRSYSYQEAVFQRHVESMGREEASRVSAEPGKSQHQLGTAVDFGSITPEYAETPAGRWLEENAWRYGFSLSYPEGMEAETGYIHECWHFRYITPAATHLERLYFDGIQQYMLEFLHYNRDSLEDALADGTGEVE
jgi:D-alanyl-D-alanine carboxypeptidase